MVAWKPAETFAGKPELREAGETGASPCTGVGAESTTCCEKSTGGKPMTELRPTSKAVDVVWVGIVVHNAHSAGRKKVDASGDAFHGCTASQSRRAV
jgi:hypothetical protein